MSRLEDVKRIIKSNYPPENYTLLRESLDWLIQQAEKKQESPSLEWYEINSKKLAELNYFLQEKKLGNVGDHVVDVVTDYVENLEQHNQRYKRALELVKDELEYAKISGNDDARDAYIKKSIRFIEDALKGESE